MTTKLQANLPFIQLDQNGEEPLYLQIYRQVRRAVLSGILEPGVRLPTSRELAKRQGVSRNTVVNAYAQLQAEGYLNARVGSGTFVSRQLPEDLATTPELDRTARGQTHTKQIEISQRGSNYLSLLRNGVPRHPYSNPDHVFRLGVPDLGSFPFDTWRRIQARKLKALDPWSFGYKSPLGFPELRQALADYLKAARGVRCHPDQIIITNGSQQALFLIATILTDPGDDVWLEDPCYQGALRAFAGARAEIHRLPVDEHGIQLRAEGLEPPRVAYITPSHQFPLGVSMPLARRLQLLNWAEANGVWLVEDDYDSEYRYQGRPLPALQGLDRAGRVIYVGSFSKVLFPALRLGYLVLPSNLVEPMLAARLAQDLKPPLLSQATLAEFIEEGEFSRHVRRMRVRYAERAETIQIGLDRELGHLASVPEIEAGLHVTLKLPASISDWEAAGRAIDQEVQATPLSIYCSEQNPLSGLVLGFAAATPEAIDRGCQRLAAALSPIL